MRRFKLNKILYLAVIASLASLTPSALAQAVYGSIFGTITDNTGAVVPNAKITITDIAKGTVGGGAKQCKRRLPGAAPHSRQLPGRR